MDKGKIGKRLILMLVMIVLLVAVLEVVPLRKASNAYKLQSLTAEPQSPATTTLALKKGWLVFGDLNEETQYFTNTVSLYIFEPDGKTLVLSKSYDVQHNLSGFPGLTFNFTANVEGNYVFLLNGMFLSAPPPPYQFQPKVTMTIHAFETGMTTIL